MVVAAGGLLLWLNSRAEEEGKNIDVDVDATFLIDSSILVSRASRSCKKHIQDK
jgi:hypothetical protein